MKPEQISAIALEVANEIFGSIRVVLDADKDAIADFATRFLAAITAKAEPVATVRNGKVHWHNGWPRYDSKIYANPITSPDAFPQAHRLALELECLLLSCTDTAAYSKWWDSANEALEQWRQFKAIEPAQQEPLGVTEGTATPAGAAPLPCGRCNGSGWVVRDPDIGTDQECFVCEGRGVIEGDPVTLPDDVAQMVERLRKGPHISKTDEVIQGLSADMIERLARQVPEGCVVVPRKASLDMLLEVLPSPRFTDDQRDSLAAEYEVLIAAGEVK